MKGLAELGPHGIFAGAIQFLVLLLAISVHESAHAWTALRSGDSTGADLGRISLNPLRHIDPIGSVLVPLLLLIGGGPLFGWAKPNPVRLANLGRPEADHMLIVLAGPICNLLVALGSLMALATVIASTGSDAAEVAAMSLFRDIEGASGGDNFPLLYTLVQFAFLNAFLGVFNMIPIPPLDGGQVALHLLPQKWALKYSAIRPYGFMIVLALAALNVLSVIVLPVYLVIALVIQASG